MDYVIEMLNITKKFPGILANDNVSLQLLQGEIHALLGENGAGKSTLMSILFGLYKPESGIIKKNGEQINISNPNDANAYGIGMVHQHFKLVHNFTVLQNIILGVETTKRGFLKMDDAKKKVIDLSAKYHLNIDPDAVISDITVGMQQRAEILKMLYRENEILIFDEPTAMLTPQEIDDLMQTMRGLAKEGKSILFITHKLDEIKKVADRCTILRKGKYIATVDANATSKEDMAEMMVGRKIDFVVSKGDSKPGEALLKVNDLTLRSKHRGITVEQVDAAVAAITSNGKNTAETRTKIKAISNELSKDRTQASDNFKAAAGQTFTAFIKQGGNIQQAIQKLTDYAKAKGKTLVDMFGCRKNRLNRISFEARRGEILCIAGIDGNGQSELVYTITGLAEANKGTIELCGQEITKASIRQRSEGGMSHIPEDRHKHGLILDYSLAYNLVMQQYYTDRFQKLGFLRFDKINEYSDELIKKFDIRSGQGRRTIARSMSGGNQQKAIVAREIDRDPEVLVAVQPTRGLDVGAIEYIHKQLVRQRDEGKAVLLVSLELDEVLNVSDRILVIYEGEIVADLDPKKTTEQELGLYMSGAKREAV